MSTGTAAREIHAAPADQASLPAVLLIGPTPPPYHGLTIITSMAKRSPVLARSFRIQHLDTADRRGLDNIGRLDLGNVLFALRHGFMLLTQVVKHRPDVIYLPIASNTWGSVRDAFLLLIARLTRRRIATHLHGSDWRRFYDNAPGPVRWLLRRSTNSMHAVGVLSEGLRPIFAGVVPAERVHVATPWIEDPFPNGAPRREAGARITIAYVGMLYRPKGFLNLIEALGSVTTPDVRLVLAGGWYSEEERADAQALVERLEVQDRVTFTGRIDEQQKWKLLESADIFVFPGIQPEGLPLAVLEAMAAGLPAIATPMGTIPEAIRHEREGLIIQPGDVRGLAAAIDALAADPGARHRMGAAARLRFESRYTEERAIGELVALLQAALPATHPPLAVGST
jgi:glycosyltransferase involved in cell wall biosynthesis